MIKHLIEKYYDDSCSDTEKQEIKQFFQEHPEKIEQYFNQDEWEAFEQFTQVDTASFAGFLQKLGTLPKENQEGDLTEDQGADRHIGDNQADDDNGFPENDAFQKKRHYRRMNRLLLAACICLIIGMGGYSWLPYFHRPSIGLSRQSAQLSSVYTIQTNRTKIQKIYLLPDQSEVRLYPGGSIKYLTALKGHARDIFLTGEAVFKVHPDTSRPFTVYCREVATTALGTIFSVKEQNQNKKVAVRLLEGKILVRSTDKKEGDQKDYYLLPGSEIAYSRLDKQFSMIENQNKAVVSDKGQSPLNTDIIELDNVHSSHGKAQTAVNLAISEANHAIQFKDVKLSEVLDLLAEKRGIKISYPTNKVSNINFIGTISDQSSTKKVLSDIAAMNDLHLSIDTLNNKFIME